MRRKVIKSAVDGEFVSPEAAKNNKRETYTQTTKVGIDIDKFVGAVAGSLDGLRYLHDLRTVLEGTAHFPHKAKLQKAVNAQIDEINRTEQV